MAYTWDTTCVIILRNILGDLSDPPTYSDLRLRQLLMVAAQFVSTEVPTQVQYIVDVNAISISPDPQAIGDNAMIVLTTLKAACMLDQVALRTKAGSAVKIGDARSTIDTTPLIQGFQLIMSKGACNSYEEAKWQYLNGGLNSTGVGQAILGPFAIISAYGAPGYMYSPNSPIGREAFH